MTRSFRQMPIEQLERCLDCMLKRYHTTEDEMQASQLQPSIRHAARRYKALTGNEYFFSLARPPTDINQIRACSDSICYTGERRNDPPRN